MIDSRCSITVFIKNKNINADHMLWKKLHALWLDCEARQVSSTTGCCCCRVSQNTEGTTFRVHKALWTIRWTLCLVCLTNLEPFMAKAWWVGLILSWKYQNSMKMRKSLSPTLIFQNKALPLYNDCCDIINK